MHGNLKQAVEGGTEEVLEPGMLAIFIASIMNQWIDVIGHGVICI